MLGTDYFGKQDKECKRQSSLYKRIHAYCTMQQHNTREYKRLYLNNLFCHIYSDSDLTLLVESEGESLVELTLSNQGCSSSTSNG